MKKKDKMFTMRMPSEIHNFLKKYSEQNYTSVSNTIIQLILNLKRINEK